MLRAASRFNEGFTGIGHASSRSLLDDRMLRQLIVRYFADSSGEMLRATAKAAAFAALFSVGVAYVLSERLDGDRRALDRLAAATGPGVDMTATGSIRKAGSVKLDPCAVPATR